MSDFQLASVLVDTENAIRGKTGLYTMQKAYATDFNNAELFWNGSAWSWSPTMQTIFQQRNDITAPPNTTAESDLISVPLPRLGTKDTIHIAALLTVTD